VHPFGEATWRTVTAKREKELDILATALGQPSYQEGGFPIRSREAKLLIDLLMRASKESSKGLPTAEQVLLSALRMFHDKTAVVKVAKGLAVSPLAAERALAKLPNAAITLAF
jgi:hypothetical protein